MIVLNTRRPDRPTVWRRALTALTSTRPVDPHPADDLTALAAAVGVYGRHSLEAQAANRAETTTMPQVPAERDSDPAWPTLLAVFVLIVGAGVLTFALLRAAFTPFDNTPPPPASVQSVVPVPADEPLPPASLLRQTPLSGHGPVQLTAVPWRDQPVGSTR